MNIFRKIVYLQFSTPLCRKKKKRGPSSSYQRLAFVNQHAQYFCLFQAKVSFHYFLSVPVLQAFECRHGNVINQWHQNNHDWLQWPGSIVEMSLQHQQPVTVFFSCMDHLMFVYNPTRQMLESPAVSLVLNPVVIVNSSCFA